jgi:hypothetical protein
MIRRRIGLGSDDTGLSEPEDVRMHGIIGRVLGTDLNIEIGKKLRSSGVSLRKWADLRRRIRHKEAQHWRRGSLPHGSDPAGGIQCNGSSASVAPLIAVEAVVGQIIVPHRLTLPPHQIL